MSKLSDNGKIVTYPLCDYLLGSSHFTGFQAHFNSVRMVWGISQDVPYYTARPLTSALILF
jgi:hypothetical protein